MDQHETELQLEVERRARGRAHSSKLLHMLRGGYGSAGVEPTTLASVASKVAEAPTAYVCRVEATTAPPHSAPEIASVAERLQHPHGTLGALMAGVDALEQARRVFNAYLRQDLCQHALLIRLDTHAWVVQTEAAVWAVRLRYALFEMREELSAHCGFPLPKPQIHIVPNAERAPAPSQQRRLTPQAGRALEELARDEVDPKLRAALWRLAHRA